jgi:radical SAM superfamily enzyme
MARKVTPRLNYLQDAIVMRRTAEAVQADNHASPEWKEEVTGHLHAAMRLFLEKDSTRGTNPTLPAIAENS